MPSSLASPQLLQSAVVLAELRVLYVPVQKAASTTVLWALARLAGLDPARFESSRKLEVTRALAVHDRAIWGIEHTLTGRSEEDLDQILSSGSWFRFTVVREPTRRLWSAWVSKLLARDPRFVAAFGHEAWFPPRPTTSTDVVDSFRRFVRVLPTRPLAWHDPHWAPQAEVVSVAEMRYDHIGRADRLEETFAVLADAIGVDQRIEAPPRANESPLPFAPELFDAATLDASDVVTAPDRDAFGFSRPTRPTGEPGHEWHATVDASIGAVQALIDRNDRIGDFKRLLEDRRSGRRPLRLRAARRP